MTDKHRPPRTFVALLAAAAVFASFATQPVAAAKTRPNILFIFTDDHASHAMSCYGSKINKTPNLDRIAKGGCSSKTVSVQTRFADRAGPSF